MRIAIVLLIVIGVLVVVGMRLAASRRPEEEGKLTSTATTPPRSPGAGDAPGRAGPPPGSRLDRERRGRP